VLTRKRQLLCFEFRRLPKFWFVHRPTVDPRPLHASNGHFVEKRLEHAMFATVICLHLTKPIQENWIADVGQNSRYALIAVMDGWSRERAGMARF
jgi:hypothetical protein